MTQHKEALFYLLVFLLFNSLGSCVSDNQSDQRTEASSFQENYVWGILVLKKRNN